MIVFLFVACGGDIQTLSSSKDTASKNKDKNETASSYSYDIKVYFPQTSGAYHGGVDERVVDEIQNAKKSIYLAIYEMTNDKFRDALIDAHSNGVEVVVMTDDDSVDDEDIKALKNAGILVYDDHKSALMHNKFLVLDDKILWSGSANYTYYSFYRNYENLVRICDKDVALFYKEQFFELVNKSIKPKVYDKDGLQIYFSPEDNFQAKLIQLINNSKKSVYFMIFAFTQRDVADALVDAKNRGVEVVGVFDEGFNNQNSYSLYSYLKNKGVDVKLDGNSFKLHDKVMMIDDEIVVTGSYNFTNSANSKNAENSIVIKNKKIYNRYEEEFRKVYSKAKE